MNRNLLLVIGAVVLLAAGYMLFLNNQTQPAAETTTTETTETPTPEVATLILSEQNDSGELGTAILKEEDSKTTVTLNVTGFAKDVPQPAHIHVGACPGVGAVKYPLNDVLNGTSVTTLNVTLDQLRSEQPLGLNVHKSTSEATVYVSCGDLAL